MQCTVREAALSDGKPGYRIETASSLPQYADARRSIGTSFGAARRYADFESLHALLSSVSPRLPALPGTRLFASAEKARLFSRQRPLLTCSTSRLLRSALRPCRPFLALYQATPRCVSALSSPAS